MKRFFAISLAFVCLANSGFAQALARKPLREGHLEKYDNPPAFIFPRLLQVSPRMVSPFGPYVSYQVNVDQNGNNILGDAANEPSICVDPTNTNRISIGWRQFNSVSSNFRQAGWAYSSDNGVTWTFPGVLEAGVFRSDPVLNSDATGQFYYLSLLNNFFDDIWRSVDGGQSFANLAPATGGDKEWFTIDKTNSSGRGFQYQSWSTAGNNFQGRQFSRSTDGGLTWRSPVAIPNTPIWGTLDVDTNGTLFIGGVNPDTGQIWCVRSTNAKNAAVKPSFDQSTLVDMGGDMVTGEPINPEGLVGQINLAVDRSGTSLNNNVYMLGSLQGTGSFSGSDIMFVRSTNGGRSFSAPVRINDDPVNPNKWHWFGALAVAPNGRIDCVWLDTRNAPNDTDSQLYYSSSSDGGVTWTQNVPVSNSFNPFLGYPNQDKMGDYITVVSDNNGASVAYAATFNGEEDVYYLRIPATPAQTFVISLSASPPAGGSVTGGGSYASGSTVSVTAMPNTSYNFTNWTENGSVVSSAANYSFTATAGRTLVANFVFTPPTVATPVFSPNGGTFMRKVKVKIMCATPGATIHYTTDGSDPTSASPVYPTGNKKKNAGVLVTGRGSHTVKAIAIAPNFNNSPIAVATFTIQ
jgi:hypothetical protein